MPYRIQTPSGEGHYYGDVSRLNAPYNPSPGLYQYPSDGLGAVSFGSSKTLLITLGVVVAAGAALYLLDKDKKTKKKRKADKEAKDAAHRKYVEELEREEADQEARIRAYEKKHPKKAGESSTEYNYRVRLRWEAAHSRSMRQSLADEIRELRGDLKYADNEHVERQIHEKIKLHQMALKPLPKSER